MRESGNFSVRELGGRGSKLFKIMEMDERLVLKIVLVLTIISTI